MAVARPVSMYSGQITHAKEAVSEIHPLYFNEIQFPARPQGEISIDFQSN